MTIGSPQEAAMVAAGADDLGRTVLAVCEQILRQPVTGDTDFFEAGGDSLAAMDIVATLSGLLERDIPLELFLESRPLSAFVRILEPASSSP